MFKLTFLGTASAVPDPLHHNSHFIVETDERKILVDCGGNPIVRLKEAYVDPKALTDVILTHFHPDHVSGIPLLLMDLWLMGRTNPLCVHGLTDVLTRVKQMMTLYHWEEWDEFYQVVFHDIPSEENVELLVQSDLTVKASLVCHMIPAIGLRFEAPEGVVVYSTDTGPCDAVVRLAQGAQLLIHEASGSADGHSSAAEAAMIAARAGVEELILTHYPPQTNPITMIAEAKAHFEGKVSLAEDLQVILL